MPSVSPSMRGSRPNRLNIGASSVVLLARTHAYTHARTHTRVHERTRTHMHVRACTHSDVRTRFCMHSCSYTPVARSCLHALAAAGLNQLPEEKDTPFWELVLKQFNDLMVKILLAVPAQRAVRVGNCQGHDPVTLRARRPPALMPEAVDK